MKKYSKITKVALVIIIGFAINMCGSLLVANFNLPIYLDSIGTIGASVICGYIPGIIVGLVTNIAKCIYDPTSIYYTALNVLIALTAAYFAEKGYFRSIKKIIIPIVVFTIIGGLFGYIITWFLYGSDSGFLNGLINSMKWDLIDKVISVVIVFLFLLFIKKCFNYKENIENTSIKFFKRNSLQSKLILFLLTIMFFTALIPIVIGSNLFSQAAANDRKTLANSVCMLMENAIDAEKVDKYIETQDDEYDNVKNQLIDIQQSVPDIKYMYIYQIKEDGCHVVFDLDTEDTEASKPGEIIPFDDSFEPHIDTLLKGGEIEPIISDDTYGYLLTIYKPVYNKNNQCVCYVATDISMLHLRSLSTQYVTKMISVLTGFVILILFLAYLFSQQNIISPIVSMSKEAKQFSSEHGDESVERIKALNVNTHDEIEELHHSLIETTSESVQYVKELNEQKQNLSAMQEGLIIVLADVVESRDEDTGTHIQHTANYVELIMKELRKDSKYQEMMTDDYITTVVSSAPLHDVGKIKISDTILNKPGKLTDEEFEIMKTHTIAGKEIIEKAMKIVPDPMYLNEARNIAYYHHEKWNGKGYPCGLKGEDIPLSARIMAVADVFDALISPRCYKKAFSFEKAIEIIKEGAGQHFDPEIVRVFFNATEQIKEICSK